MVHVLIVAEDGVYGSCITADFNSISHSPANAGSNAAFQFCIVIGIYNFNRQLLCKAVHFAGPCRRRRREQRSARKFCVRPCRYNYILVGYFCKRDCFIYI